METVKKLRSPKRNNTNNTPLHALFKATLREAFDNERVFARHLPSWAKAATTPQLTRIIENYTATVKKRVNVLQEKFTTLVQRSAKGEVVRASIRHGNTVMINFDACAEARDAALVIELQKISHHQMAVYGALAQLARTLQWQPAAAVLHAFIQAEKEMDIALSALAESKVNKAATKTLGKDEENE